MLSIYSLGKIEVPKLLVHLHFLVQVTLLSKIGWLKTASGRTGAKGFSETCLLLVERFLWTFLSAGTI